MIFYIMSPAREEVTQIVLTCQHTLGPRIVLARVVGPGVEHNLGLLLQQVGRLERQNPPLHHDTLQAMSNRRICRGRTRPRGVPRGTPKGCGRHRGLDITPHSVCVAIWPVLTTIALPLEICIHTHSLRSGVHSTAHGSHMCIVRQPALSSKSAICA
eukprot:TRINITY_DN4013_c0_g2_i11.p1 TRINITY_DN4013_c0_g2~~TRINITY_DN4013_c0_g2_i11.p1  ORF type:complete len:157 (+),score=6.31 TRINITY_DN4013_c0_g2_i11:704-1174(+)